MTLLLEDEVLNLAMNNRDADKKERIYVATKRLIPLQPHYTIVTNRLKIWMAQYYVAAYEMRERSPTIFPPSESADADCAMYTRHPFVDFRKRSVFEADGTERGSYISLGTDTGNSSILRIILVSISGLLCSSLVAIVA